MIVTETVPTDVLEARNEGMNIDVNFALAADNPVWGDGTDEMVYDE